MAKLKKEVDGWIVPYCVRVLRTVLRTRTRHGKWTREGEQRLRVMMKMMKKTLFFICVFWYNGNWSFQKCSNSLVFIDASKNKENRDFKKPYKTCCFLSIFDLWKQNCWKNVGFYRFFENHEISNVRKSL